jgi:predicted enzyme related to lactoylglutathione lyase
MSSIVRAVMIFADEPLVVASWWADLLGCPSDRLSFEDGFVWFEVGDIEFGFHPSDAKENPVGGSPVVYLRVEDHSAAVARAESIGARLHRGPLAIGASRWIAQLIDPFGNVFGLDGPLIQ